MSRQITRCGDSTCMIRNKCFRYVHRNDASKDCPFADTLNYDNAIRCPSFKECHEQAINTNE